MKARKIQPKETFRNLASEKRERILQEAVREFAANGYERASVNTIVKRSGIAKGSLYQYFANKEAFFLYVFGRFTELVKTEVKSAAAGVEKDFFTIVQKVLWAGIGFIDTHPAYYRIYLKVLFEQDVPQRRDLVSQVRLFSVEYFGPLCEAAQDQGLVRRDIPADIIVFMLDATLDRFLQGYARSYLDGGLGLAAMEKHQLAEHIEKIISVLRDGFAPANRGV